MSTVIRMVVYRFDEGGIVTPSMVEQSFNLLFEFCDRLRDHNSLTYKAFKRVIDNQVFTQNDVELLANYAQSISQAAEEKYNRGDFACAPWREAVLQNTARLRGVMEQLRSEVHCCE